MKFIIIFCVSFMLPITVSAGVVLGETRIIYLEGMKEKNIRATNKSDYPHIVQVWVEADSEDTSPFSEAAQSSPFLVSPAMAKLGPQAGQALRIIKKSQASLLPNDRESLFIFNMVQVPPVAAEENDQNILQVLVKKQLKLFYRPKSIAESIDVLPDLLSAQLEIGPNGNLVRIKNPTGYFATFVAAEIRYPDQNIKLDVDMLPPFSEATWLSSENIEIPSGKAELLVTMVNDYGARVLIKKDL